jgi:trimethylamine--corrinoid protein Co-methyltransferase
VILGEEYQLILLPNTIGSDFRMRRNRNKSNTNKTGGLPVNHRVGGGLNRLSENDLNLMLDAAIQILEAVGLAEVSSEISDTMCDAGAQLSGARVTIPRTLVLEAVDAMPKTVLLAGQAGEFDMQVGGENVYLGTGGAAPMVQDLTSADYRAAELRDLYDAARIAHNCRHIDFFARSVVARDIDDPLKLDRATTAASLMGCAKHVMVQASDAAHVSDIAQLCYDIAGGEDAYRARPFLSLNINHAVPPLRLHNESMLVMRTAVKCGIPVHCNVFGQVGASSPVTLAGAAAQTLAETLAGLVWVHMIDPAAPRIAGPRPMITDLRTGGLAGGSGEQALSNTMVLQVLRHLNVPCSIIAGATGSRHIDHQAGYEKALGISVAISAGANLVTQAAGSQASLMGTSLAGMVADNDMLGAVLRAHAPVTISQDTLALDTIQEVVEGEGHFLGQPETYARMRSDFVYPDISERAGATDLDQSGVADMQQRAIHRAHDILNGQKQTHLPKHIHDALAAEFGIGTST